PLTDTIITYITKYSKNSLVPIKKTCRGKINACGFELYVLNNEAREKGLALLEVAKQAQNFGVEPDQSNSQAKSHAPRVIRRNALANHLVSSIKISHERQRCKTDAQDREDDSQHATIAQRAVTGKDGQEEVTQGKKGNAKDSTSNNLVKAWSNLYCPSLVDKEHAQEHADGPQDCLADKRASIRIANEEAGEQQRKAADKQSF